RAVAPPRAGAAGTRPGLAARSVPFAPTGQRSTGPRRPHRGRVRFVETRTVFGAADNGSGEEQEAISLAAGQGRPDSPAARFCAFWQGQLEGPLVALWSHFPSDDLASPEALASAHARTFRQSLLDNHTVMSDY